MDSLNKYQKAAVIDNSHVLLVNAHVGSGKTTVLTQKVLYLHFVKGVPLQSMVVLTFTNKAAQEIKNRIKEQKPELSDAGLPFFGTFHSVARTLLATVLPVEQLGYTKDFSIVDADGILEVYDRVIKENSFSIKYRNKIKKRIEKFKQGSPLYASMKQDDDIADFLAAVMREKIKCNIMTFDDLIDHASALLPESSFSPDWVIIDEFQDCDEKQLKMIEGMSRKHTHIFAVGDPNQIIYTWRGSKADVFDSFKRNFEAQELTLPVNYRSTTNILEAAAALIGGSGDIEGMREPGHPIVIKRHHNTFNEALYLCEKIKKLNAEGVEFSEIAIFYRKQKHAEVFKDVFEKQNIPFEVSIKNHGDPIPNEDIQSEVHSVKLMTLHASKGLEFKYVFISCANLGMIPIKCKNFSEEEEEKRLFFVGMTRAKDYLEISYHTNPDEYGVYSIPSPYLRMIPERLIESQDFKSRASNLSLLRKEIKNRQESRENSGETDPSVPEQKNFVRKVYHEKYGLGNVSDEDESNIKVNFEAYGEKTFSKLFCPLKYID